MIQYKTTMLNDKLFVKVNPQYTSQECSHCGNIDKNNRPLGRSMFTPCYNTFLLNAHMVCNDNYYARLQISL